MHGMLMQKLYMYHLIQKGKPFLLWMMVVACLLMILISITFLLVMKSGRMVVYLHYLEESIWAEKALGSYQCFQ